MARRTKPTNSGAAEPPPASGPSDANPENSQTVPTNGPQFCEPAPTPDPTKFMVRHGSDSQAYKILDSQKGTLKPRPFPIAKGTPTLRIPAVQARLSNGDDQVAFENYDDTGYGYLRLIADPQQLRIKYHSAAERDLSETPDDSVTADLATRRIAPNKVS